MDDIADIRREYGNHEFKERDCADDPFVQFDNWFQAAVESECTDPNAMVLSTVDELNCPDSRVVLLKGIQNNQFVFYTNYLSHKGAQLEKNPLAALNFYWPQLSRQVRVRGLVIKVSFKQSQRYFLSRPQLSQINAVISPQSSIIPNRNYLELKAENLRAHSKNYPLHCPDYWGGYALKPDEFEFWQGRDNRLHDRFQYTMSGENWIIHRLAP